MQTDLFPNHVAEPRPERNYIVRRYAMNYVREGEVRRVPVSRRDDVRAFVADYLGDTPVERVTAIALDSANRIVGYHVTEGIVNQCAIYPRQIIHFLLDCGAASCIIAHNHPGGNTSPSRADWTVTERIHKAGKILECPLLDHIIVADDKTVSLRDFPRWPK